jgi:hypothetical protein
MPLPPDLPDLGQVELIVDVGDRFPDDFLFDGLQRFDVNHFYFPPFGLVDSPV